MHLTDPILLVVCLVYNHVLYLRDCFEGFLLQETDFPFIILVHDDASTDGSDMLIREYAEKYPHIFKPIYEVENLYSKKDGSLERVITNFIINSGVRYVAMCEGDDYWLQSNKLQKQFNFMENNPECSICFHKVLTLIHKTGEIKNEFLVKDMPGESTIEDLALENYIHTTSVVYRVYPSVMGKFVNIMPCMPSDYVLWMLLSEKGYIYKFDDELAVYRYGVGEWSRDWSIEKSLFVLIMLCKLIAIIDSPNIKYLLHKRILEEMNTISREYTAMHEKIKFYNSLKKYKVLKVIKKLFS